MSACPACRAVSSSRCINTHRRLTGDSSPNIAAGPIQTRRRDDGVNPGPSVAVGPDGGGQRVRRVHHVVGDFDVRTGEATQHPEQVRAGQMLRQPTQLRVTLDHLKAKKDQVALFANRPSTAILTAAPPMTVPAA